MKPIARSWLEHLRPYRKVRLISYLQNRKQLTSENTILLSYPRSGNTWTRYLLADLVLQSLGFETNTILPIEFWRVLPSIYTQSLTELAEDPIWTTCKLVKSHEHQDLVNQKTIYIIRRPEDVLCSWYYFNLSKNNINAANISLDRFCTDKLGEWIKHVEIALQYHDKNPGKMLWLCYELLHKDPQTCLKSMIRFLNLTEEKIDLKKAVQNHTFEARQKAATKKEINFATRKGKIGDSKSELQQETQKLIQQKALHTYKKAYELSASVSQLGLKL